MRKSERCPNCGDYQIWGPCKCVLFHVKRIEVGYEDQIEEIYACTPEEACAKWAEELDMYGDYDIIAGNIHPVLKAVITDKEVY